jgi:S1-C subfamily serine protease
MFERPGAVARNVIDHRASRWHLMRCKHVELNELAQMGKLFRERCNRNTGEAAMPESVNTPGSTRQTATSVLVLMLGIITANARTIANDSLEETCVFIKVEAIGADDKPKSVSGSGVCVLPSGYIVTNAHVVRMANVVRVVFRSGTRDEFECAADVVALHPDRDLALLKCKIQQERQAIELGSTKNIKLTDSIRCVGFPLGAAVVAGNANPSISIVPGAVSSLRRDSDGRLHWIDFAAPVAGGNSGGALVDARGRLTGVTTQRYEGFGRAVPVECVRELIGQAAFVVHFNPDVAPQRGKMQITITPTGPAQELRSGTVCIPAYDGEIVKLRNLDTGLTGTIGVRLAEHGENQLPIVVQVQDAAGLTFDRVIGLPRQADPKTPLRVVIRSIRLKRLKPNGWRWDADQPDPFCKLYVEGLLVQQTPVVKNQYRFMTETAFECKAGDTVRIVVFDEDVARHDWAGEICFTAEAGMEITTPTEGELQDCEISVRAIPLRLPVAD